MRSTGARSSCDALERKSFPARLRIFAISPPPFNASPQTLSLSARPSSEDIARVIVACLVDPAPHIGKAYRPTGPRTLAPAEIAAVIGKALRRPVRYQDAPISLFLKAATSLGLSDFVIAQLYW